MPQSIPHPPQYGVNVAEGAEATRLQAKYNIGLPPDRQVKQR